MISQGEFCRRFAVIRDFLGERERLSKLARVITGEDNGCAFGSGILMAYMDQLAESVGDKSGWVTWFVWENDMGHRRGECTVDGKKINVSHPKQLYKVIMSTQKEGI